MGLSPDLLSPNLPSRPLALTGRVGLTVGSFREQHWVGVQTADRQALWSRCSRGAHACVSSPASFPLTDRPLWALGRVLVLLPPRPGDSNVLPTPGCTVAGPAHA